MASLILKTLYWWAFTGRLNWREAERREALSRHQERPGRFRSCEDCVLWNTQEYVHQQQSVLVFLTIYKPFSLLNEGAMNVLCQHTPSSEENTLLWENKLWCLRPGFSREKHWLVGKEHSVLHFLEWSLSWTVNINYFKAQSQHFIKLPYLQVSEAHLVTTPLWTLPLCKHHNTEIVLFALPRHAETMSKNVCFHESVGVVLREQSWNSEGL